MMIHGTRSEWGCPSCGITGVILTITLLTLGIYLMRVARWHLRDYPTLIGGGWDLGWVVLGASGLLGLQLPALLAQIHEKWRAVAVSHERPGLLGTAEFWQLAFLAYFFLVVGLILLELRARLGLTHLYNLRAAKMSRLLLRACLECGLRPHLDKGRLEFTSDSISPRYLERGPAFNQPLRLTLKADPWMNYGQLRWSQWNHPARAVLEEAVFQVVGPHAPRNKTPGTLLLGVATGILLLSSGLSVVVTIMKLRGW